MPAPPTVSSSSHRQLEVLASTEGSEHGSLLWLLDQTMTAGGGRLMRRWVSRPLRDRGAIEERLDAVQELLEEGGWVGGWEWSLKLGGIDTSQWMVEILVREGGCGGAGAARRGWEEFRFPEGGWSSIPRGFKTLVESVGEGECGW